DPIGDGKRRIGSWHTAVDSGLKQHLADLLTCQAVAERGTHMHRELIAMAAGDERGDGDATAGAAVQSRTRPDLAPRVARDEVLEVSGQRLRRGHGAIDVRVTEDRSTHSHA